MNVVRVTWKESSKANLHRKVPFNSVCLYRWMSSGSPIKDIFTMLNTCSLWLFGSSGVIDKEWAILITRVYLSINALLTSKLHKTCVPTKHPNEKTNETGSVDLFLYVRCYKKILFLLQKLHKNIYIYIIYT